jgi:hypothetical protein
MADEIIVETTTSEVIEVGLVGPQGPKGDKGDPGDVAGAVDWANITGKPSTFTPSAHQHVAADVTDFAAAVAAVSPPVDWNSLTGKPATFPPSSHTHTAANITDFNAAAAAAAPVQSVAGRTGAVTLAVADVSGAVSTSDSRLSDARTPSSTLAHASTHHTGGTDAIAPNNISAAWALVLSNQTITGNTLLAAGRNRRIVLFAVGATANVDLPYENNQAGDVVTLVADFSVASTLTIRRAIVMSGGSPIAYSTLATLNASGQSFAFVSDGTATGWTLRAVDTHTHTAADINSQTAANGHVLTANGSGGSSFAALPAAGTKTYAVFTALDNQPPSTAFATLDTRGTGIAVLDFDDATDESAVFVGIIPEGASLGSGLKIRLHWMATTATSGNCAWDVSLERMTTDLDSDSFDTIASAVTATSGTAGIITVTEITLTTIDSVTAGDGFRLKVTRDANNGSDTMTGDAELVVCEVRSAA